jgi:hypothetical protein
MLCFSPFGFVWPNAPPAGVAFRARSQPKSDSSDFGRLKVPELAQARVRVGEGTIIATAVVVPSHDVKQPISFPRRVGVRGLRLCFTHPKPRGGRSADRRSGACEAPVRRIMCALQGVHARLRGLWTRVNALMTRYARRLRGALRPMARDARLSALHRGFALPLIPAQAGIPCFRRDERQEAYATPRSAFGIASRRRPSMSEADESHSASSIRSQYISTNRRRKLHAWRSAIARALALPIH